MEITHVGSLPHLDISSALDYTFLFDVPVMPSLPQLHENEFMHLDLVTNVGMGEMLNGKLSLNLKGEVSYKYKYLNQFLHQFDRTNHESFKFQLIGPSTLWSLSDKINSLEEIIKFLTPVYAKLVQSLARYGDFIFVLDEPILNQDSLSLLNQLVTSIKGDSIIGLHTCAKQEITTLNKLENFDFLNIDADLYSHEELIGVNNKRSLGTSLEYDQEFWQLFLKNTHNFLLTPSCGLGIKNIKELEPIFNRLQGIKRNCLASNLNEF